MTLYAIGDLQGCYDELQRLLDKIAFDPDQDRLWLVGDLVNRGPKSLETLRWVKNLGSAAVTVLGNHDLHLLAAAHGVRQLRPKDSLNPILTAPDRDELIAWLRTRPLLHLEPPFCLVHAGIYPAWDLAQAQNLAHFAEQILAGNDLPEFLEVMYGDHPANWSDRLEDIERWRFVINAFTRMRYLYPDGRLNFNNSGPPGSQPVELTPWFAWPKRKTLDITLVFGHWSTLGLYRGDNCFGIDTGALWGGSLTALTLTKPISVHQIQCTGHQAPGKP